MIGFVTWPPLYEKRWPSDKANHTCENICYNIVCHSRSYKSVFDKVTGYQTFGRACLFAMLLLIGLALFYIPSVFV